MGRNLRTLKGWGRTGCEEIELSGCTSPNVIFTSPKTNSHKHNAYVASLAHRASEEDTNFFACCKMSHLLFCNIFSTMHYFSFLIHFVFIIEKNVLPLSICLVKSPLSLCKAVSVARSKSSSWFFLFFSFLFTIINIFGGGGGGGCSSDTHLQEWATCYLI